MTDLREVLLDIRRRRNELTPAVVVDEAQDESHPLHDRFEWDDTVAGHRYRLSQAAELLRVNLRTNRGTRVRAFVPVKRTDGQPSDYRPIEEVANDPLISAIVLQQFEREWQTLRVRYEHLSEFVAVIRRDIDLAG